MSFFADLNHLVDNSQFSLQSKFEKQIAGNVHERETRQQGQLINRAASKLRLSVG